MDKHFIIKTDHQSLKHLLDQMISIVFQHTWLVKLHDFDYEIYYKQGKENKIVMLFQGFKVLHYNCLLSLPYPLTYMIQ